MKTKSLTMTQKEPVSPLSFNALTDICKRTLRTGEWSTPRTQLLIIALTKKSKPTDL